MEEENKVHTHTITKLVFFVYKKIVVNIRRLNEIDMITFEIFGKNIAKINSIVVKNKRKSTLTLQLLSLLLF